MKGTHVKKMRHTLVMAAVLALLSAAASADTLTGRVIGVSDGDTLTVLDDDRKQHKVRLSGIDSPEKKQPFGQVCKQSLSDLTYDRAVRVEWDKLDRWGRLIGRVVVNGQDVNLVQLERGCGWHYKKYQNEQPLGDRLAYNAAEESARTSGVGLWASNGPMPPWDWRKARRK
jgi:endonuclease YncB( thermonuclease family)